MDASCVAVCCSVLPCVAVSCSVLQCERTRKTREKVAVVSSTPIKLYGEVLQFIAVCCSVLQCVAV